MIHHELEALIQGALDHTLTKDEQERLARMISENPEARDRAAQLTDLVSLLDSLGQADVPLGFAGNVLAEVSHRPIAVPLSTFQRGVAVNKKILFGLAAAAAIVLAVITYNSNPPATVGTEATIGAAQRAQTPQIASSDVKLGDTAAQDMLQTETFDAIMKDETLRTMLQDAELRSRLQDAALQKALQDENIKKALSDPALAKHLADPNFTRALNDSEYRKKFDDSNMRWLLSNDALRGALKSEQLRSLLSRGGYAAALAGRAMQQALRDSGFDAAMKSQAFAARLAAGARVQ